MSHNMTQISLYQPMPHSDITTALRALQFKALIIFYIFFCNQTEFLIVINPRQPSERFETFLFYFSQRKNRFLVFPGRLRL